MSKMETLFATRFEARRLVRVVAAPLEQPQEMERLLSELTGTSG